MSPKAKPTALTFDTGITSAIRPVIVDGHEFTMDFDDADLLREILAVNEQIQKATEGYTEGEDPMPRVPGLLAIADDAKRVIDQALGEGAYVTIFGRSTSIVRALKLVTLLSIEVGPAYDAMFAEYVVTPG